MHGVGGEYALEVSPGRIRRCTRGREQFAPDPDFPTVPFPNPEEPGATDEVLKRPPTSKRKSRSRWTPTPTGARSGYRHRWLADADRRRNRLAARRLRTITDRARRSDGTHRGGEHGRVVANAGRDRRCTRRPTRRNADRLQVAAARRGDLPGNTLVYAYEEAIGHCVDPSAVRDKDGISAAVLACEWSLRCASRAARCSMRSMPSPAATACTRRPR